MANIEEGYSFPALQALLDIIVKIKTSRVNYSANIILEIKSRYTSRTINSLICLTFGVKTHRRWDTVTTVKYVTFFTSETTSICGTVSETTYGNLVAETISRVKTIITESAVTSIRCDLAKRNVVIVNFDTLIILAFASRKVVKLYALYALI